MVVAKEERGIMLVALLPGGLETPIHHGLLLFSLLFYHSYIPDSLCILWGNLGEGANKACGMAH